MQNIALCFPRIRAMLGIPSLLSKQSVNSTGQSNTFIENLKKAFKDAKIKQNNEIVIHNTKPLKNI